jgi:hypothetical protein
VPRRRGSPRVLRSFGGKKERVGLSSPDPSSPSSTRRRQCALVAHNGHRRRLSSARGCPTFRRARRLSALHLAPELVDGDPERVAPAFGRVVIRQRPSTSPIRAMTSAPPKTSLLRRCPPAASARRAPRRM